MESVPLARGYRFGLLELGARHVTDSRVSPAELASAMVAASMRMHLTALGARPGKRGQRARCHVLCAMAERSFARHLPDGAALEERAWSKVASWAHAGESGADRAYAGRFEERLWDVGIPPPVVDYLRRHIEDT